MLGKEESELLSRVGPNTPMGDFLREYWLPVLPSERLDEPDGRPQRVRLLCEDLILFRDSDGRPGLLADNCAHRGASLFVFHPDRNPHFEIVPTDWGLMYGARREQDAEHYYWRVTQYLFPYTLLFPSFVFWKGAIPGHMWVPVDDYNVLNWTFRYHPSEPYSAEERERGWGPVLGGSYLPPTSQPFGWTRPIGQWENDYLLDPEVQRSQTYTGIPGALLQDQAVTESMGPMLDRTIEHLGSADLVVIQARQLLLKHLNAYKKSGVLPPGVDQPELYRRRSASVVLPKDEDWIASTKDWVDARPDALMGVLGT